MILPATAKPAMPPVVARGRAEVCRTCPTPCAAHLAGQIDHAAPASSCPLPEPRWRAWAAVAAAQTARKLGLGDVVAAVAQPIAKVIDATTAALGRPTNVAGCGGCTGPGGRKDKLNAAVPDVTRPLRRRPRK